MERVIVLVIAGALAACSPAAAPASPSPVAPTAASVAPAPPPAPGPAADGTYTASIDGKELAGKDVSFEVHEADGDYARTLAIKNTRDDVARWMSVSILMPQPVLRPGRYACEARTATQHTDVQLKLEGQQYWTNAIPSDASCSIEVTAVSADRISARASGTIVREGPGTVARVPFTLSFTATPERRASP